MNGWLIYDQIGASRNQWFIHRLIDEAKTYSVDLQLRLMDEIETAPLPDFAIVRTIAPKVNQRLEAQGVRTVNNYKTANAACDKWETYLLCKKLGLPVLETSLAEEGTGEFPKVLKARNGHGGSEVFWVENRKQVQAKTEKEKKYILQRPSDTLGRDMRIYAIGGEIVAAVLRQSDSDFRSNFSLGGRVSLVKADETQKEIVKTLYNELKFDFVGIDFLPHKGGWVLNEIEDAAGTRMLYQCSDIDIVKPFMQHVIEKGR